MLRQHIPLLAIALAGALSPGRGWADTLHVPGDYATLADAADAATGSDEILLAGGMTHHGPADVTAGKDGLVVRGAAGAVYDDELRTASSIEVRDLHLEPPIGDQGGVRTTGAVSALTVSNCSFTGGEHIKLLYSAGTVSIDHVSAEQGFHFLVMHDGGHLEMSDCTVAGGGDLVSNQLGAAEDCSTILTDCSFTTTVSTGMVAADGSVEIDNCTFDDTLLNLRTQSTTVTSCTFRTGFSGITAEGQLDELLIQDCEFSDLASYAVVLHHLELSPASWSVIDCLFVDNEQYYGLAMSSSFGGVTTAAVRGCTFSHLSDRGLQASGLGSLDVSACTFFENGAAATGCGSQISLFGVSDAQFEDCLITGGGGAGPFELSQTQMSLACCDIWNNAGGDYTGACSSQEFADALGSDGNVSVDPEFCESDPNGSRDWSLSEDSPVVLAACGNDPIGAWPASCSDTGAAAASLSAIKARY